MKIIYISKLTIIGSDDGLSSVWHQAIIWISAGILLIIPLGTNFSEILFKINTFSFKKIYWNRSSGKWRPFCLRLNPKLNSAWQELKYVGWHFFRVGDGVKPLMKGKVSAYAGPVEQVFSPIHVTLSFGNRYEITPEIIKDKVSFLNLLLVRIIEKRAWMTEVLPQQNEIILI